MNQIYRIFMLVIIVLLAPFSYAGATENLPSLEGVLEACKKALPPAPLKQPDDHNTSLEATRFLLSLTELECRDNILKSLKTIDPENELDSLLNYHSFHIYDRPKDTGPLFKDERAQNVGNLYKALRYSLQTQAPFVAYLYGCAFKSSYPYDLKSGKGKVISSEKIDLQELVECQTYSYVQEALRALGINFHFVIIRDTFHALALRLTDSDRLRENSPEIGLYGEQIHKMYSRFGIKILNFHDLKNQQGDSFESFLKRNPNDVMNTKLNKDLVLPLKGFMSKEYAYEAGSNKTKEQNSLRRAERYVALKEFVRLHEANYLIPSLIFLFGPEVTMVPFSIHVEEYTKTCRKIPLRTISNFSGGCNAQHQLPLVYIRGTDLTCYTVRSDKLNALQKESPQKLTFEEIEGYATFVYRNDVEKNPYLNIL